MEKENNRKSIKQKYHVFKIMALILIIAVIILGLYERRHLQENYTGALQAIEDGRYSEAKELLDTLGKYYYQETDSYYKIVEQGILYEEAKNEFNSGNYKEAISIFESIEDFKYSKQCLLDSKYNYAVELYNKRQYKEALTILIVLEYKDSNKYTRELLPIVYKQLLEETEEDKN